MPLQRNQESVFGDTVELTCVAEGWPLPTYRWYKDGSSINVTAHRFRQHGGHLVISNVTVEDTGEYLCNASNNRGSVSAKRQLLIRGMLFIKVQRFHCIKGDICEAIIVCYFLLFGYYVIFSLFIVLKQNEKYYLLFQYVSYVWPLKVQVYETKIIQQNYD